MKTLITMDTKELKSDDTGGYLIVDRDVYTLGTKTVILGRHSQNDCVVNGAYTSRQHAKIEYVDGNYVIYDLNSTSGTYINKERIVQHVLSDGDIITLGKHPVIFMYDEISIYQKHEVATGVLA